MRSMTIVRVGGISLIAAALGFIGVFAYLAAQFDYLLPLWTIIFGVALVRDAARETAGRGSESFTPHQAPTS